MITSLNWSQISWDNIWIKVFVVFNHLWCKEKTTVPWMHGMGEWWSGWLTAVCLVLLKVHEFCKKVKHKSSFISKVKCFTERFSKLFPTKWLENRNSTISTWYERRIKLFSFVFMCLPLPAKSPNFRKKLTRNNYLNLNYNNFRDYFSMLRSLRI